MQIYNFISWCSIGITSTSSSLAYTCAVFLVEQAFLCAWSMWPRAATSYFDRNLVMLFSVKLGHVANFLLFTSLNRVDLTGLNSALVRNSNISFILVSGKTELIWWQFPPLKIHRWRLYSSLGTSSSFSLHNLVWCYLHPSITCLPPLLTLMLVLSNMIVHPLSESNVNDTRFWVRVGNVYPLRASLFKVDTFISAWKVDTIWDPSGFTAWNASAGRLLSVGVSIRQQCSVLPLSAIQSPFTVMWGQVVVLLIRSISENLFTIVLRLYPISIRFLDLPTTRPPHFPCVWLSPYDTDFYPTGCMWCCCALASCSSRGSNSILLDPKCACRLPANRWAPPNISYMCGCLHSPLPLSVPLPPCTNFPPSIQTFWWTMIEYAWAIWFAPCPS